MPGELGLNHGSITRSRPCPALRIPMLPVGMSPGWGAGGGISEPVPGLYPPQGPHGQCHPVPMDAPCI